MKRTVKAKLLGTRVRGQIDAFWDTKTCLVCWCALVLGVQFAEPKQLGNAKRVHPDNQCHGQLLLTHFTFLAGEDADSRVPSS